MNWRDLLTPISEKKIITISPINSPEIQVKAFNPEQSNKNNIESKQINKSFNHKHEQEILLIEKAKNFMQNLKLKNIDRRKRMNSEPNLQQNEEKKNASQSREPQQSKDQNQIISNLINEITFFKTPRNMITPRNFPTEERRRIILQDNKSTILKERQNNTSIEQAQEESIPHKHISTRKHSKSKDRQNKYEVRKLKTKFDSFEKEIGEIKNLVTGNQSYFQNLMQKISNMEKQYKFKNSLSNKKQNTSNSSTSFNQDKISTTDKLKKFKNCKDYSYDDEIKEQKPLFDQNNSISYVDQTGHFGELNDQNQNQTLDDFLYPKNKVIKKTNSLNKLFQEDKQRLMGLLGKKNFNTKENKINNDNINHEVFGSLKQLLLLFPDDSTKEDKLEQRIQAKLDSIIKIKEEFANELFEIKMENGLYQQEYQIKFDNENVSPCKQNNSCYQSDSSILLQQNKQKFQSPLI